MYCRVRRRKIFIGGKKMSENYIYLRFVCNCLRTVSYRQVLFAVQICTFLHILPCKICMLQSTELPAVQVCEVLLVNGILYGRSALPADAVQICELYLCRSELPAVQVFELYVEGQSCLQYKYLNCKLQVCLKDKYLNCML